VYKQILKSITEDKEIIKDSSDKELREMAKTELDELEEKFSDIESELKILLLPKDTNDHKNCVIEIRAGTGGLEAALFAGDLFRMYSRFIEEKGWKLEELSVNPAEVGGFKEVICLVDGKNAYGSLKYESGVHRVQRIPVTESGGRIHTSAASVAVLPDAEEIDIYIDPKDIKVDVYRSSGPGGQSVNTTDSAVRVTHVPTAMVVTCQDEKSQHKNKAKALKVLRARLYDQVRSENEEKVAIERRSQILTGDRSEKIRTYNFPQNRVTDHRINLSLHKLESILNGEIDELLEKLMIADRSEKINRELEQLEK
ncbi:peptide chain release factor 1, partial [candidate division KSB1 bacterium]